MDILLRRELGVGMTVTGSLIIQGQNGKPNTVIQTIENKHYLFNDGNYQISLQYSPKFNTHLWEFNDIRGRAEIKFHEGYYTKNSRGCILLRSDDLDRLHSTLDDSKTYKVKVKTEIIT